MEKLNSLNKDPKFKKLMTEEEDRRKYENTIKKNAKEEGITEEKIKIAKELLKNDTLTIEYISSVTELSIEDITQIKNEIESLK